MSRCIQTLILISCLCTFLPTSKIFSQQDKPAAFYIYDNQNYAKTILCDDDRTRIHEENAESIKKLKERGLINSVKLRKITAGDFNWPLKPVNILTDESYYVISGFVDHDENYPDQLLDYNGGTRTYDTEDGYNHRGTDFATWPYPWYKMDHNQIEVISMAPGIIIGKSDGHFDRSCAMSDSSWNAVYVLHDNGAIAWYGHMKKNSLTAKVTGDTISTGEYLGIVGSSGSSTGPHLHLEIYDAEDNLIDPWAGPYNPSIASSWWVNQPPYYDSKILTLSTNSAWPVFPECPQQEIMNLKNEFAYGDTIFFVSFYRDLLKGDAPYYKVTNPENQIYADWYLNTNTDQFPDHLTASWWGWYYIIPETTPGTWEYSIFYNNVLYRHYFTVTENPTSLEGKNSLPEDIYLSNNYPNPFNPSTIIRYGIPAVDATMPSGRQNFTSTTNVTLRIYDILGNEIATLVNEQQSPGYYEQTWNANNLSSGIYFYMLTCGNHMITKKMNLLK